MRTNLASDQNRRLTRRGVQRRKALLEAALNQFAEAGFDGATTKAIAERSGVTEAVIFRYFPTKRDLFQAVVAEYGPPLHYPMDYEAHRDRPFVEALSAVVTGYLDHAWSNRKSMRLFLLATLYDSSLMDQLTELYAFRLKRLHEMMAERIALGELRPEAKDYGAEVLTLTLTGFMVRSLRLEPKSWDLTRDRFVQNLTQTIGLGLVAQR